MGSAGLEYHRLGPLKEALAEAARTDEANAESAVARFIELRPGIQETLLARRHHLVTGRRGTGKSTLLHVVRQRLRQDGSPVAVIDMERYKGRPFPDVLIEILIALLDELRPSVRARHPAKDLALRRKFQRTRQDFAKLLADPQSFTRQVSRRSGRRTERNLSGRAAGAGGDRYGSLAGEASSLRTRTDEADSTEAAEFEELKIERLRQAASSLSAVLSRLVDRAQGKRALIFIDDYYYVRLDDQPAVLDYLHQVCKGTGIWLKVGGVGTRMRPYRDGDPPVGMQPTQDIDRLPIDVTLDDFGTAQRFLEQMLEGVISDLGLTIAQLFTPTARSRMVLACGGAVARDYITLTAAALDAAVERLNKSGAPNDSDLVNVQAEDVNRAARRRMNKKEEEELNLDAGSDAYRLKQRWRDVCDFIREQGETAFILVKQRDLDEEAWGAEIQQLENLRLLHRIRDAIPNTPNWRGVKTMVFMVDLGQVADQRLRTGIPEFWTSTAQFDKLRRAEWVYSPGWRMKAAGKGSLGVSAPRSDPPADGQPTEQGAFDFD